VLIALRCLVTNATSIWSMVYSKTSVILYENSLFYEPQQRWDCNNMNLYIS
jgi:hypothetical protein